MLLLFRPEERSRRPSSSDTSEQPEGHFNRYLHRHDFACRSRSRFEFPLPDCLYRFFIQSQSRTLQHLNVRCAPVGGDNHQQHYNALVFRFARFVRILWIRAVQAARHSNAIHSCPERSATSAATFAKYGEMSNVETSVLFFASVDGGRMCMNSGTTIKPISATCSPIEITWVQPKFSSLVQISLTLIGLISNGSGACLAGAKNSFSREPNPPNPSTQPFASLLLIGPFGTGRLLKNSPPVPQNPPPSSPRLNTTLRSPRILTARSNMNCFTL